MIKYTTGNIINADVEALVNTVNTVGVMGKGIALAFKKAFPSNFKLYKKACDEKSFFIGKLLVTETGQFTPKFIVNFPTKQHWRGHSKVEFIEIGMQELVKTIEEQQIKSIAIPPLGCGNGGLRWEIVKPIILKELSKINREISVIIYEPGFNNQNNIKRKITKLTPARAMLLKSLEDYKILGYAINLLVIQKIAYFLQRLGEPLNLNYEKGYYGPYAHSLQHLLKHLNGHYLEFKDEKIKPTIEVKLHHFETVKKYSTTELTAKQIERLKQLQALIEGFETPYGLELLATVDFVCQKKKLIETDAIIQEIGKWTKRKKEIMKPFHIKVAHERLQLFYESGKL